MSTVESIIKVADNRFHLKSYEHEKNGRTWWCTFCDKSMNFASKTGHINCNFHKRQEPFAFIVEKYESDSPKTIQIDKTLTKTTNDCKDKCFATFGYRTEHNMKIEHRITGEVVYFT